MTSSQTLPAEEEEEGEGEGEGEGEEGGLVGSGGLREAVGGVV
jgi:hypothetical protein